MREDETEKEKRKSIHADRFCIYREPKRNERWVNLN